MTEKEILQNRNTAALERQQLIKKAFDILMELDDRKLKILLERMGYK